MNVTKVLPLLLSVLLAASPALTRTEPTFSEVADVVVVEVPVQVLRDDKPVRGLTAGDFEIWEGKTKRPVTGFEVLDLSGAAPTAGRPVGTPVTARRHFLLLFDLSFSEPRSLVKARDAARDLMAGLHPADLVAVATYSTTRGPQLALGFTQDRAQVEAALETMSRPEMFDRAADPLRLMVEPGGPSFAQAQANSQGATRSTIAKENDAALINEQLTAITLQVERGAMEHKTADVLTMTRGFTEFAHRMSGIQGRKYVVYLSEGFDSSLLFGTTDEGQLDRMAQAATSGQIWNVDAGMRYGNTRATNDLERMLEEFRRADCVIQAVDVGGLREGGELGNQKASGQNSLFLLADGTGGELYRNFNDLSAAMGEMLERTSVTYVLAFQPEDLKRDGEYRKLRVELKDAPRGTRVVHRAGYYGPKPFAEQAPLERLLEAGRQVVAGQEAGTIRPSVLAAPFRSDGGAEAYVPVLIEVNGERLAGGSRSGILPAEIYVYAMDQDGAVRGHVTQTVALDLAKVGPALRRSGLKFFGHLDLPPGDYSLRVLVRNGLTGDTGMKVVPVKVPAFAHGPRVLLTPFFPEPTGKWLIVREATRPGTRQDTPQVPYPFMIGEEPYIPASLPVLRDGEEARFSLVGYNLGALGAGELRIEARILTQDGREVGPAAVELVRREAGGPVAPDRLLASFRPKGLQPGEYRLVITLAAETTTTPFVVANLP